MSTFDIAATARAVRAASRLVTVLGLVALIGGASLAATACKKSTASENPTAAAPKGPHIIKMDLAAMKRLGITVEPAGGDGDSTSRSLRVPGSLDYNLERYGEVGTPLEGRIQKIQVVVGDKVKKGQLLGTIVVPSVAGAQADFLSAQAAAEAARKNRQREEELLARELTTAREAEIARSDSSKAEADLAAAEARLHALRVSIPKSDSVVASAGMMQLLSPIDGVVVRRAANLGQFLHASDTAFVVADLSELWAALDVPESDVSYLRIGAHVDLSIDALPGRKFEGKLALIEPSLGKSTRVTRARVVVPNQDGALRPGLFLRAEIQLPPDAAGRLLVPAVATQPLGEDDVVFVEREPGSFEVRPVKIGRRTADLEEVQEGLSKGDRIVVEGAFLLRGEVTLQ